MTEQVVPSWTFGDRLRKARRDARISQSEMAERLGVTDQALSAWESGRNKPSDIVGVARKLQAATGIPAEWFLGLWPEGDVKMSVSSTPPDGVSHALAA